MVPKSLQAILWSADTNDLNIEADKNYIIHQVLMYGDLSQIRWLFSIYPEEEIKTVFQEHPLKIYTPPALNFVQKVILDLDNIHLDDSRYLSHTPRITGY